MNIFYSISLTTKFSKKKFEVEKCYYYSVTKIIYYTTTEGENPVSDFLDSLNEKQQSKILRIIKAIETYGLSTAVPHIRKLSGMQLWEIRVLGRDNIRVFYVSVTNKDILLLHGFIKKSQKTPVKEINIALKRFQDYERRLIGT